MPIYREQPPWRSLDSPLPGERNANSAAPNNWGNAPVLADQVDQLKNDLDGYIDQQGVVDKADC